MQKNLVIVESPAKAKTVYYFLLKALKVMSTFGLFSDVSTKELSIVDSTFDPAYSIP